MGLEGHAIAARLKLAVSMVPLAMAVLAPVSASGAIFSSTQDGAYNTNATWGGVANPSTGTDTVTIGHNVSISTASNVANDTIGFGGASPTLTLNNNTTNQSYNAASWNFSTMNVPVVIARTSAGTISNQNIGGAYSIGNGNELTVSAGANINTNSGFGVTFTGAGTLTGTQTVTPNMNGTSSGSANFSGAIGGTGGFIKSGGGLMNLTGANTFEGGVELLSGRLRIGADSTGTVGAITTGALGKGALKLNGGTLSASSTTARGVFNAWSVGADVTLGNGTDTGTLTFSGAGTISGATRQITTSSRVDLNGDIGQSGSGLGLTKAGSAMLVLGGTNSFTGALTVNAGTLRLNSAGAWNSAASNLVVNGSTLELASGNLTATIGTGAGQVQLTGASPAIVAIGADRTVALGDLTWGSASFNPTTALVLGSATSDSKTTLSSNIDLNGAARTISVGNGTADVDAELTGVISGTPPTAGPSVTFTGAGTIRLSGASTYNNAATTSAGAGTVIVGGARVVVNSIGGFDPTTPVASSLGAPTTAFAGRVSVSTAAADNVAALVYAGGGETTTRTIVIGKGDPTLEASGTGAWVINSHVHSATGSTAQIRLTLGGTNSGDNTIVGAINNVDPVVTSITRVTKTGPGTWMLANDASTFSYGPLNINGGTLVAKGNVETSILRTGTFASGASTLTVSDASGLSIGDYVYGISTNGETKRDITGISGNTITLSGTTNFVGTDTPLEFVNTAARSSALGSAKVRLTLGSALTTTNGWDASLLVDGAYNIARPVLVNNNATTGTYSIGGRSSSDTATFSGLVTTNQPLTLKQTAGGTLNITGGITGSTVLDTSSLLTFAGPGAINVSTAGITNGSGGGTGQVAVRVADGTTTFSATNTYTGNTTVDGGTLLLASTGSLASGSNLIVNASGTIGGNGTVNGAASIAGTLSPGASEGKLTFGDTLALSGTTALEIEGTARGVNLGYDAVDVTGALTYGGALTLNFQNVSAFSDGQVFDLFAIAGGQGGSLSSVAVSGFYAGSLTNNAGTWTGTFGAQELTFVQGTGDLTISAVPEPTSLGLLAIAGMGLLRRRRA